MTFYDFDVNFKVGSLVLGFPDADFSVFVFLEDFFFQPSFSSL